MPARTSRGYRIQPASRGKHTEPWRMRRNSPASPIRPKVPVVRRRRKEHLIAVRLLKKPPGAADNFRGFAEIRKPQVERLRDQRDACTSKRSSSVNEDRN